MKTIKLLIVIFIIFFNIFYLFSGVDSNALYQNQTQITEALRLNYFRNFPKTIIGYDVINGKKQIRATLDYEYIFKDGKLIEHRQIRDGELLNKYIYNYSGDILKTIQLELYGKNKELLEYEFENKLLKKETVYYSNKKSYSSEFTYDKKKSLIKYVDIDYKDDGSRYIFFEREYIYDSKGNCLKIIQKDSENERIYNFKYLSKNKVEITSEYGYKAIREYNNSGLLVKEKVYDVDLASRNEEFIITYDSKKRLKSIYTLYYLTEELRGKSDEPDFFEEFYYKD